MLQYFPLIAIIEQFQFKQSFVNFISDPSHRPLHTRSFYWSLIANCFITLIVVTFEQLVQISLSAIHIEAMEVCF